MACSNCNFIAVKLDRGKHCKFIFFYFPADDCLCLALCKVRISYSSLMHLTSAGPIDIASGHMDMDQRGLIPRCLEYLFGMIAREEKKVFILKSGE